MLNGRTLPCCRGSILSDARRGAPWVTSALAFCLAALLLPGAAVAQQLTDPAFDLERLSLDPSGEGSLLVGGARTLTAGAVRLGLAAQYEREPLQLHISSGNAGSLVANRFMGHVLGAVGITDHLELGAELPVILYQNGSNLSQYGLSPVESSGLANPLVGARYNFFSPGRDAPYALGLGLQVGIPVGSSAALGGAGGSGVSVTPSLQGSARFGPMLVSLDASTLIRPSQPIDIRRIGSELDVQGAVGWADSAWRPEIVGTTDVPFTGNMPVGGEVGLAARHNLGTPSWEAFAFAGMGFGDLPGVPLWRGLIGVAWRSDLSPKPAEVTPPPVAKCPSPPPPATCPTCAPAKPCPTCPAQVVAAQPPPAPAKVDPCAPGAAHSPAQCPDLDDDGDGVPNRADKCPVEKGAVANGGCPAPDRDHDGIPDVDDACPAQPGPTENLGCPVADKDKDGVPDAVDNCPGDPGPASNHGCPAAKKQVVSLERERVSRLRSRIRLGAAVNFDTGSARIQESSFKTLNQLAELLNQHPELTKLRIEGHTDNDGSAAHNLKLSQARANAVMKYLAKHGVDADRLSAKGFGFDRPIASNDTEAGRARNRRVEVVSTDEGGEQ